MTQASSQATDRARSFLALLKARGYGFFSGVPCSLLSGLFRELERDDTLDYVPAVREDIAVGLAAGAYLGGRKAAVFLQNSGLGVCYNALASLNEIYEIPALLVVSWRGEGGKDAPEHLRMGQVMTRILEELEIPYEVAQPAQLEAQVAVLESNLSARRRPAALVVPKGVFA